MNSPEPAVPVLVWDREGEPSDFEGEVLQWRAYTVGPRASSVPAYLEAHAERLRGAYLAFIHDLGEARISGMRVVEHLSLDDGFSFWWMSWLAEKSPFKSQGIYTGLRLLALEDMLLARKPARLELASDDANLVEAIFVLCGNLGIACARRHVRGTARHSLRELLPHWLRGALSLVQRIASCWPLRRYSEPPWFSGNDAVFIGSFFAHIDAESCARGEFRSRYWGTLPEMLRAAGRSTNWIHQFVYGYSSDAPDAPTSLSWLGRFNADADRQGRHAFLESYLTWGVVLRASINWLRLCAAAFRLRSIPVAFVPKGSAVWLWPVLREDWHNSLSGSAGALNCLWVELFEGVLKKMPPQKIGLYLCENQGWEMAFLRSWRKFGHGKIIGVAHATVPFWHLYYLDDPRGFEPGREWPRPSPDLLAVNGPAAARVFAGVGHPAARLVKVEALRYLDLPRLAAQRSAVPSGSAQTRVIILGDVIAESMRSLLLNLEAAVKLLPSGYRFTLKPHPLFRVDLSAYPGLRVESSTTLGLDRILGEYDVALAANSTSAAIDAYLAGVPVIVGLNGGDLNLSPLRGEPGARFAGTPEELAEALLEARATAAAKPERDEFFYLDPELPRWRRLLEMGVTN